MNTAFFWPNKKAETNSFIIRLGRVLHWFAVVAAVYGMMFGWVAGYTEAGDRASVFNGLVFGLTMAIPILLAGRGARYLLSGE